MRFSTAFLALLSVGFSSARLQGRDQVPVALDDDHKIPGESPLKLCDGDHKDDILKITKVDLSPNPPKAYVHRHMTLLNCLPAPTIDTWL